MARLQRILFLCTGNSCRSQMAEALVNTHHSGRMQAFSAGVEKHGLNPLAVRVMAELGIDISGHRSKLVQELPFLDFDLVITLCGHAHEHCPYFPGRVRKLHVGFDDPPALAEEAGARNDQEALPYYRQVRDALVDWIMGMPDKLK